MQSAAASIAIAPPANVIYAQKGDSDIPAIDLSRTLRAPEKFSAKQIEVSALI
jgi:hypothetical protein